MSTIGVWKVGKALVSQCLVSAAVGIGGAGMNPDIAYDGDAVRTQAYVDVMHTLSAYHVGLDDGDFDLVGRMFADDAVLEQSNGNVVYGRAAICEAFRSRREKRFQNVDVDTVSQRHNLTTRFIEIIDDSAAAARCCFIVMTEVGVDHSGQYFDSFVRRGGRWIISRRRIRIDWMHEASRFRRTWPGPRHAG